MRQNISVLNPQVTIPASCYPLDALPSAYRDWYRAVLEQGVRTPPPADGRDVITITPQVNPLPAGLHLKIERLVQFTADIVQAAPRYGSQVAVTTKGLTVHGRILCTRLDLHLASTPRLNHLIAAAREGDTLRLWDVTAGCELAAPLRAEALMAYDERLILKNGTTLYELRWLELPGGVQPLLHPVANVLPYATQLLEGAVLQNILGACYVSVLPTAGTCYTVRVPELEGQRIVEGRFDRNVLMLVSEQQGKYQKSILRFGDEYRDYDLRSVQDVSTVDLNFVTLENGVCLHLNENEELELFSNRKGAQSMRLLNEPALRGATLVKAGTHALFAQGDTLYHMTLAQ
jgi:hypothetical protein